MSSLKIARARLARARTKYRAARDGAPLKNSVADARRYAKAWAELQAAALVVRNMEANHG